MEFERFMDTCHMTKSRRWALGAFGLGLCLLAFIASRAYLGVRHDGLLYAAQALRHLHPQVFAEDLFFRFGSQDSFTVFGRLYASLVGSVGLELANRTLILLSQALFLGTAGLLALTLLPVGSRLTGLMLLVLSAGAYGGYDIFHVAEPFVTARPFAEAGVMGALVLLLRGRLIGSLLMLLGSAVLHPLIAMPGAFIWWLLAIQQDRRFIAALAALPLMGLLAALGIEPFSQLLVTHDEEWRELLLRQNEHIFLLEWRVFDWALLVTDLCLAWVIRRELQGRVRALLDAAIVACLTGVTATVWGADVFSNVLLTSLQPWRAQWILMVLVALLLPLPLARSVSAGPAGWLVMGLLAYGFINRGLITGLLGMVLGLVLAGLLQRRPFVVSRRLAAACLVGLAVASVVSWFNGAGWMLAMEEFSGVQAESSWEVAKAYLRHAPVGPLLLCLPIVGLAWMLRRSPLGIAAVAVATVAFAGLLWDQRTVWAQMLERQADGSHPFSVWIQPTDEVFWVGDPAVPWLLMHRRSYLSGSQLSGQMFNRQTAQEGARRLKVIAVFEYQQQICQLMNKLNQKADACQPDIWTLREACQADSMLRFMVTGAAIDGHWLARWTPPSARETTVPAYYLYSCDKLIQGGASAGQG